MEELEKEFKKHSSQPRWSHLFFVGKSPESVDTLHEESARYDDILHFDVIESYLNNTLKVLAVYEWVRTRCPNAFYLLKVDNDVYVNVRRVLQETKGFASLPGNIYSFYGFQESTPWVKRNKTLKQYVPCDIYPFQKFQFEYVYGFATLLTLPLIEDVHSVAMCIRGIFIDDLYLSGYIPHILGANIHNWTSLNANTVIKKLPNISWSLIENSTITPELTIDEIQRIHQEKLQSLHS